jgi:hypothetical protein
MPLVSLHSTETIEAIIFVVAQAKGCIASFYGAFLLAIMLQ